jgi:hypothetical protein
MTRRSQRRALSLILATFVASTQVTPAAHAEPRPATLEAWQKSTSVRLDADGSLSDVTALPSGEIWAVGQQQIWDVWKNRGTVQHWNGGSWSEVTLRDATGAGNLRGVSATSTSDVWAVGDGHDGLPYIAHGDAGGFDRVRVEGQRAGDWLGGIDAHPGRVVAVGGRDKQVLILTGQGGTWGFQKTDQKGALYAVSNGFAVGDTGRAPLIMHYSGDTWKAVPVPNIPGGYLRDIQVDGAKRALAVGGVYRATGKVDPLVLSWNGKRWQREKLPETESRLYGVTGDGKGRFWISGFDPARANEPFMMRCEKHDCEVIRGGAAKGKESVRLQAVTYLSGKGAVWAVGHAVDARERYTDVVESFGPKLPSPKDS